MKTINLNKDEEHILKVLGSPSKILKNMLGGYVAYWDLTTTEALNKFKKNKDYAVIKIYSPYWKIGFIPENLSLFQISNRQNKTFSYFISENFKILVEKI